VPHLISRQRQPSVLRVDSRTMLKRAQKLGAIVALIAVLAICVLPAFSLEPTALRAYHAAQQLLMAVAFLATIAVCNLSFSNATRVSPDPAFDSPTLPRSRVVDLTCSRLC